MVCSRVGASLSAAISFFFSFKSTWQILSGTEIALSKAIWQKYSYEYVLFIRDLNKLICFYEQELKN